MRIILILTCLLLPAMAVAFDRVALMQSYSSVVMIRGYNQTGGLAYGSGVVVAKDKVITNCHVLRTTNKPWINRGEDTYPITGVQADAWHDLCLVTSHDLPLNPVPLGESRTLKRGQEVTAIGHSNGVPAPLTSRGNVVGLYAESPGFIIRSSAKFLMGASGSGLFDMQGRLIGINTFKTAGKGGSIHFALPVEWLAILEKMPMTSSFPIVGKAIWEESQEKQPFYMQAAVPESRQDWPKLLEVASDWASKIPDSVDAWLALAISYEQLQQLPAASDAYAHITQLEPQHLEALFKRGLIEKTLGHEAQVKKIAEQLTSVNAELLPEYIKFVDCQQNCYTP